LTVCRVALSEYGPARRGFPRPQQKGCEKCGLAYLLIANALVCAALLASASEPYDRLTWFMEVLPLLWSTYRSVPLTNLVYGLLTVHALVLIVGDTYTYARAPLGFMLADWFELTRHPYDKIGHFMQGFGPPVLAREMLVRGSFVGRRKMLAFIVVSIVLAVSASYEMIEWASALALGQGAREFLGTQGDSWDTQSDMFLALLGALVALATCRRRHDHRLRAFGVTRIS
jgi:putative membrane protein